jgi:hypothetical protein
MWIFMDKRISVCMRKCDITRGEEKRGFFFGKKNISKILKFNKI